MKYTSVSDVNDDTRDLVRQGLASVKRKRVIVALQPGRPRERLSVTNMDTSSIRHPLCQDGLIGATLTHGLNPAEKELANGQNHSIDAVEGGSEVVAEQRSARAELSRRAGGRELSSEEMLIAYGELERKMKELQNKIGRKTNPSDTEVRNTWREHLEISRAEAYGDLETRAAKLAETAERVRERRYSGARVIKVAPIRKSPANADATDAPKGPSSTSVNKRSGEVAEQADIIRVKTKAIKKAMASESKKIKLEKREKSEASKNNAKIQPKKKKIKTKLRKPSTSPESSDEEEDAPSRRRSHRKGKGEKKKSKHRSSDTDEDEKKYKKSTKDKSRKDKNKTKRHHKLEFSTDESSKDERSKNTRKYKTAAEDESTLYTSS